MTARAHIGVTGMAVMGSNLARNFARNGYTVAVHNRTAAKMHAVVAAHGGEGDFIGCETMTDFAAALMVPRTVIIMVKAGGPTDAVIAELTKVLSPGDIIVDAGNAHFPDTIRRERELKAQGFHFVGMGVSGGEEGALWGPSIMPGGSPDSYQVLGPMLEKVAAQVADVPCCTYVGSDGAGHYVKMVHNGIEYADMQLIAEAYDVLRTVLGASAADIGDIFAQWNTTDLESYLIEITAQVLRHRTVDTGAALVDVIVDAAAQKGTGRWTVQSALDLDVPVTGIAEATFARSLSGAAPQRATAQAALKADASNWQVNDRDAFIEDVRLALYASKVVAYSQGFELIAKAAQTYGWEIDRGAIARIWRGGCIIRARFLDRITQAYVRNPQLALLLADDYFAAAVGRGVAAWRRIVAGAAMSGIPTPAFSSSLSYYDGVRSPRLPAALIQGQRDYFGAHTYQRIDKEGTFHTLWSGDGSEVAE